MQTSFKLKDILDDIKNNDDKINLSVNTKFDVEILNFDEPPKIEDMESTQDSYEKEIIENSGSSDLCDISVTDDEEKGSFFKKNLKKLTFVFLVTIAVVFILLNIFGISTIRVTGDSMLPTYKSGDMVLVQSLENGEEPNVGDILVFDYEGLTIIHRCIAIDYSSTKDVVYLMKGDNENSSLEYIIFEDIESKVLFPK